MKCYFEILFFRSTVVALCFMFCALQNMAQKNNNTKIAVIVNNTSKQQLSLYFFDKFNHIQRFHFKKDSVLTSAIDTVLIDSDQPLQLRFPKDYKQNPVYVFPGDTIYVRFSSGSGYTFKSKYTPELNFPSFLEINNIRIHALDLTTLSWHDKINVEAILEEHTRMYNARLNALNQYADSLQFAAKYRQIFKNEIELIYLLGYLQPYLKLNSTENLPQSYFAKLDSYKQWINTDTTLRYCFFYRLAILCYDIYLNRTDSDVVFFKHYYFSAKQNYIESIRYFVQFHILHEQGNKLSVLFQECLNDFRETCPIKEYIHHLDEEIAAAKLAEDSLVYDKIFLSQKLIDINGENMTWKNILENNTGKVSYTDIWASWCGPCRMEMPYSIKLQNELSNEKLSYVYISIDNDKEKWLKAITETRLSGKGKQHYLLDPDSKLAKFLTPNGIPKYFIINKKGTVEYLDAPRPSDPKIKEILTDLVHK